ncbi:hypothetical protein [Streptomyces lavendulae]|uniref:hypothetical protein n=1 Tax=Streptomyces lavendulae TaxID=1914 RepID=UPI00380CB8B9
MVLTRAWRWSGGDLLADDDAVQAPEGVGGLPRGQGGQGGQAHAVTADGRDHDEPVDGAFSVVRAPNAAAPKNTNTAETAGAVTMT